MKLTGAQAIIKALELEKVEVIFGYPGAAISPFYDALLGSEIRHVLTRHEQGAAHAASGYARASGKTGVCVATSGPGATNLITGIATAYMDSIPMVAITGQVSTELIGRDVFQEADITGATAPFCKHNYLVKRAEDLPRIIKEAFHIASTGRPGPVVIDIPVDVQNREIEFKSPGRIEIKGYKPTYKGHSLQIKRVAEAVEKAKAPIICAGGGIINAGASEELVRLVEHCRIPVTTTLMGIGALPAKHSMNLGMVGSHGSHTANYAVYNADLVIILGARVGDRAMGAAHKIAERAKVVHVDIDPAEIGKNIDTTIPVVGDVKLILQELLEVVKPGDTAQWLETLKIRAQEYKSTRQSTNKKEQDNQGTDNKGTDNREYVNPKTLLSLLMDYAGENAFVATEVGQNQIWAANHLDIRKPGTFISSGGMGTMGYGLPSAVGAKVGRPEARVIAISGDGSFQMSMQELGTMKQSGLGIKIIVFNNNRLGMVRELQKSKHGGRYSQVFLEHNPDFVALVGAYGFKGERITGDSQIGPALERMFADDEPYLLECAVNPEESTL